MRTAQSARAASGCGRNVTVQSQARKLAAFERFVEAFVSLAARTAEPPGERKASLTSEVG